MPMLAGRWLCPVCSMTAASYSTTRRQQLRSEAWMTLNTGLLVTLFAQTNAGAVQVSDGCATRSDTGKLMRSEEFWVGTSGRFPNESKCDGAPSVTTFATGVSAQLKI